MAEAFISIPYGAIKSLANLRKIKWKKLFQFLMVRLKAILESLHHYCYLISIPYGAIKSYNSHTIISYERNFNSLWCD